MPVAHAHRFVDKVLDRLAVALGTRIYRKRGALARSNHPTFATPAEDLELHQPFDVTHSERIHLGSGIRIGPNSLFKLVTRYPRSWMSHPEGEHVSQRFEPELYIGDRVTVTGSLQMTVYQRITIEDDVLIASNVYISDGSHAMTRGDRPYKYQGIEHIAPVHIGRGTWIGQNVVILPGVTIGAHAVVGANSVVTRDLPDGAVAVGAPARVVRRWDAASEAWVRAGERVPEVTQGAREVP
jgi:acetyltransferase-like isoleucine patch superfamily enzyme